MPGLAEFAYDAKELGLYLRQCGTLFLLIRFSEGLAKNPYKCVGHGNVNVPSYKHIHTVQSLPRALRIF